MRCLESLKSLNERMETKELLLKQKNEEMKERYGERKETYGESRHNGFGVEEVENEEAIVYLSGIKKERLMQECLNCGLSFEPSESGGNWQPCKHCRSLQKVENKKCPLCFIDHNPSLHLREEEELKAEKEI